MSTPGPGPGAYTIEGLMGKVPKYLLPGGPRHVWTSFQFNKYII